MNRLAVFSGTALLVAVFFFPLLAPPARAADLTWTGDQTITDTQSYTGDTITLTGNLTVASGGSLTLNGVTLKMNCATPGQYYIEVLGGGTLVLSRTTIQAVTAANRFHFWVRADASLDMDNCNLRNCGTPTVFADSGLYIQSSLASVTNSSIQNCCAGVFVDSGASPFIYKNNISQNDWVGVAVYGGGRPVIDNNVVSQNMRNIAATVGGGIVSNGASPFISNNTISGNVDSSASYTLGIYVLGGGFPNITNNVIRGHDDAGQANEWAWAIFQPAGTSYVANNTITGNANGVHIRGTARWVFEHNNIINNNRPAFPTTGGYGYADWTSSTVSDCNITGGRLGIFIPDASLTTFTRCRIADNTQAQVCGDGQASPFGITLTDCEISGAGKHVLFDKPLGGIWGGICNFINTTHDNSSVEIHDEFAQLIVKWTVHVRVTFQKSGDVADGAKVKCLDKTGGLAIMVLTNLTGWTDRLSLEERTYGGKAEMNVTKAPYNITAEKNGIYNWTVVKLNQSYELELPLDDVEPWVVIDFPTEGAVVNRTTFTATGTIEPGCWININGAPASVTPEGSWSASVKLPKEGPNDLLFSAVDRGRNYINQTVRVVRDTTAPELTVTAPADGFLTNLTSIVVRGTTSDTSGATFVNGVLASVSPDGTFSATVELKEGENRIKVESADAVWNTASVILAGERDTVAPELDITSPAENFATPSMTVTVKGTTEKDCAVTVNGQPVTFSGTNFTASASLSEGDNTIDVQSQDPAGNVQTVLLHVVRDSTPPALKVNSPADGAILNTTFVQLEGETERGALVRVNGGGVSFDGKRFTTEVRLEREGENRIVVEAYDALKNKAELTLTVILDTIAPELKVNSPGQGLITNKMEVEVKGRTEPGANVTVNGEPVEVDQNGLFTAMMPLEVEGLNEFVIESWDLAYNVEVETVTVVRDTMLEYDVRNPREGQRVKWSNLTVSGTVEPGATVTVQGLAVTVRQDGTFMTETMLSSGLNTISIMIRDKAGNAQALNLNVTYAKPQPAAKGAPGFEAPLAGLALAALVVLVGRPRRRD